MALSIRYATPEDAILVADMSRQTFFETFAPDNSPENMTLFMEEQFTRGKLMLEVGAKDNTFLLVFNDDTPAGYAKLREGPPPKGLKCSEAMEIARIYCAGNMIGKGIGKLLMQTSLQIAKEKCKQAVWLGVWEKNQKAIKFYTGWGFTKFGETDFLLGNDIQKDWLMAKFL